MQWRMVTHGVCQHSYIVYIRILYTVSQLCHEFVSLNIVMPYTSYTVYIRILYAVENSDTRCLSTFAYCIHSYTVHSMPA